MRHPRLSVCLIVRDEAANLARCLSSVKEVADQIVVVDTGSADGTPELARRLGAQVDFFPWTESFAEARNRSLELARGEWVLVLDADEELLAEDGPRLLECIDQEGVEAYFLQTLNLAGERLAQAVFRHPVLRLFRNRPEYRYRGRIHETVLPAILARAGREAVRVAPVRIRHYGYLKRTVQEKGKAHRNLSLLLKEKEERPPDSFLYYNLGVEYLRLGEYQTALDCFDRAEAGLDWRSAFAPSLVLKKADCLRALGRGPWAT
ncbi:MAG: glycosyltransferase [Moorellales bacterium]